MRRIFSFALWVVTFEYLPRTGRGSGIENKPRISVFPAVPLIEPRP